MTAPCPHCHRVLTWSRIGDQPSEEGPIPLWNSEPHVCAPCGRGEVVHTRCLKEEERC